MSPSHNTPAMVPVDLCQRIALSAHYRSLGYPSYVSWDIIDWEFEGIWYLRLSSNTHQEKLWFRIRKQRE